MSATPDTVIATGQTWRRDRDQKAVIIGLEKRPEDWERFDVTTDGKRGRRGLIFSWNLRRNYTLESESPS